MLHEIPLGRETIHGHFSASLPPVLTVDPGDSVRFQALDAWWRWVGPDEDYFDTYWRTRNATSIDGLEAVPAGTAGAQKASALPDTRSMRRART